MGTLAQDGVLYALRAEDAIKAVYTADGETTLEGYLLEADFTPLTAEALEAYLAQEGGLAYLDVKLYPVTLTPVGEVASEAAPKAATHLATLAEGTLIYADETLQAPVGTLTAQGVAYLGEGFVAYTLDNAAVQVGYLAPTTEVTPLTVEQEAALAEQAVLAYEDEPLPALALEPYNYTLEQYGFPGLPDSYTLDQSQQRSKADMTKKGLVSDFAQMAAGKDYVQQQVFVFAKDADEAKLFAAAYGATVVYYYRYFGFALIQLSGEKTTAEAMSAAADLNTKLPAVYINGVTPMESEHKDAPVGSKTVTTTAMSGEAAPTWGTWQTKKTNDPFLSDPNNIQHLLNRYVNISSGYQYMHEAVGTYAAWGLTMGNSNVKVFVMDSGVLAAHEDLSGHVEEVPPASFSGLSSSISELIDAHGTHVAGIIAATANNGAGGAGIAPGVTIYAYRGNSSEYPDSFPDDQLVYGFERAIDLNVHVINLSLGGPWYSYALDVAVQKTLDKGIPIFAAQGNDSMQTYNYPAHYSGVISVASTDNNNTRSFYSTYADATLSAPGSNILSTAWNSDSETTSYQSYDGTSMACPVAVGCAALYFSARGATHDLNGNGSQGRDDVAYLQKVFTSSATRITGSSNGMGAGIINIANVFAKMTAKPTLSFTYEDTDKNHVPPSASVTATSGWNGQYIVYTTNGTNPAVKGGIVTNGTAALGSGDEVFTCEIPLTELTYGKHTVKAICVNAQGISSAVASLTFTIDDLYPSYIYLTTASNYVAVGKKFTFKATLLPASSLKPVFSITEGGQYATIAASTGVLTAKAVGTVQVIAQVRTAAGDVLTTDAYQVNIVPYAAKAMKLVAYVGPLLDISAYSTVVPVVTLSNNTTLTEDRAYIFASSNSAVATVDGEGVVQGVAPGTAKITCAILDGSGKSATFTYKVMQPVEGLAVGGFAVDTEGHGWIARGKKLALKAVFSPANVTDQRVTWGVSDYAAAEGVTISSAGVLSVPATYTGSTFSAFCQSVYNDSFTGIATFAVQPSALSSVALTSDDSRVTRTKGIITGGYLYSYDVPGTGEVETLLQLSSTADMAPVAWTSSNTKVLTVDETGLLTAVGVGSAKITCTVMDGGGKSACATFKVLVPVSNINVFTDSTKLKRPYSSVAFGKSRTYGATVGSTYGTPSVKKVTWSYELREYNTDYDLYDMENTSYYVPLTSSAYTRYIKISSGGVLSVAAGLQNLWATISGEYYVKIIATATDGSGVVGFTYAQLTFASTLKALNGRYALYYYSGGYFYREMYGKFTSSITIGAETDDPEDCGYVYMYCSSYNMDLGVTSSKPSVASPVQPFYTLTDTSGRTCYVIVGNYAYPVRCLRIKGDKVGSASIKVFTNDGSNQSASFNVKVTY